MGSPAVSWSRSFSRIEIISRVFFRGSAASACATGSAAGGHVAIQQLLTSSSNGVSIQVKEVGQQGIAAMTKFDGFQAGVQASLLLIEQAVEEQNGGLELFGQNLQSTDIGHDGNRLRYSPRQILLTTGGAIDRCVQVPAVDFAALKAALVGQLTQRVLHFDVQSIGKINGKETLRGIVDKRLHGRQQGAITGEPNRLV